MKLSQFKIPIFIQITALSEDPKYEQQLLFNEIAKGNENAFSKLVHHFYPVLLPFITRLTKSHHVAEEILQEVFLKLWQKRAELELDHPEAWLRTVAANMAFNWLRREALHDKLVTHLLREQSASLATEEAVNLRETQALLNKAVDILPERQRLIFRMSRNEGLSSDEIAKKLQISPNTVKNQLVNALRSVRAFMKNAARMFFSIFF
jgi:RNA polymerase sigma-70 factor (ECF subfamily)